MMVGVKQKVRVGVIFGGKSAEHEISLLSAKNVIKAIDATRYEIVPIGISHEGRWYLEPSSGYLLHPEQPKEVEINAQDAENVTLVSGTQIPQLEVVNTHKLLEQLDVVFPVLHGPYGEDGTVQGLLKLANVPFVGPDVLGSAVGMDKDVAKRLLKEAGIPTPAFEVVTAAVRGKADLKGIVQRLGLPVFVKPANLGSSVGITKVEDAGKLAAAIDEALKYDNKAIIEAGIDGREIECSVMGNEQPTASAVGEIIPHDSFYSYEAKYLDKQTELKIPAELPAATVTKVQELAIKTFITLCCEGMARVDFFLQEDGEVLVSEINTIPGFTNASMYPKLWEVSGVSYPKLIDTLISLALARFKREAQKKTSYDSP